MSVCLFFSLDQIEKVQSNVRTNVKLVVGQCKKLVPITAVLKVSLYGKIVPLSQKGFHEGNGIRDLCGSEHSMICMFRRGKNRSEYACFYWLLFPLVAW